VNAGGSDISGFTLGRGGSGPGGVAGRGQGNLVGWPGCAADRKRGSVGNPTADATNAGTVNYTYDAFNRARRPKGLDDGGGASDSSGRTIEGRQETVARRVDLAASEPRQLGSNDRVVPFDQLSPPLVP
jgi:hypothetical protein